MLSKWLILSGTYYYQLIVAIVKFWMINTEILLMILNISYNAYIFFIHKGRNESFHENYAGKASF